ncbi:MAG TPA: HNH endonuclease signature motif containing protein [Aggregatilineaceae bacterium]|nr:HNH endonuclease signature motif containing protein [Aggregatilineaceae bacterium]
MSAGLRRDVIERAGNCCEYCRVSQEDRVMPYEVDHIIAEKHGGATTSDNLCWSGYLCNGYKGSDIGSIDWEGSGKLTALFNPRQQKWDEHFRLNLATAYIEAVARAGLELSGDCG